MNSLQLTSIDKNETYSQKVYRQLKHLILSNQIKSGQPLNERALVDQLQISRTPIRDALKLLEQEGWVVTQGKTKVVNLLTVKMVRDLIDTREPLELLSYDLAVKRITEQDIKQLEKLTLEMKEIATAGSVIGHFDAMEKDTEFHTQIARITRNQHMIQIISAISDQMIRTSILSVRYGNWTLDRYASNHNDILYALKEGDYAKGRQSLIEHIATWRSHLNNIPGLYASNDDESLIF